MNKDQFLADMRKGYAEYAAPVRKFTLLETTPGSRPECCGMAAAYLGRTGNLNALRGAGATPLYLVVDWATATYGGTGGFWHGFASGFDGERRPARQGPERDGHEFGREASLVAFGLPGGK